MNHIPSQSISKSILLATPLFLLVLAVLHSSQQLSYLFILDFVYNVGGSADILFVPTLQPLISQQSFRRSALMTSYNLQDSYIQAQIKSDQYAKIPLINTTQIQNWVQDNDIVKGASPRWLIPTKSNNMDTLLFAMNIQNEIDIGTADQQTITPLQKHNAAVQSSLLDLLGLQIGDKITIQIQPKNMLAGIKLFQKFQQSTSKVQNSVQVEQFDPKTAASYLYDQFDVEDYGITKQQFTFLVQLTFDQSTEVQFMVQQSFNPSGLYPSKLHNVIIVEMQDLYWILTKWILETLVVIGQQDQSIKDIVPEPYRSLWPNSTFQILLYENKLSQKLEESMKQWALLMVCSIYDREYVYSPNGGEKYEQFSQTLESMPSNSDAIVLYPFFKESLAVQFFFDSVIQIFEFVTFILYFYTMTLIMKQIYEQKQIQVGLWRTLGAGAVSKTKEHKQQIQLRQQAIQPRNAISYKSNFRKDLTFQEKFKFYLQIAIKVGFIYYWVFIILASVILYTILKFIIYRSSAKVLKFSPIQQPFALPVILALIVFGFISILCIIHISKIFTNSLSETIKPVKRTFDVVKVRIIHLSTFGVSLQVLMIAVMLIYYGVVSYYWIPFAVLDEDVNLQVLLFNSIFLFMIFGAIILLSIIQSRIQILIFKLIFRFNKPFRCLKLAILKNIKAKQYKNIKVAIIISVIFAFVLFFTAGINIQIQIIQSFIERALGSNLVFENYGVKVFDAQKVEAYLNTRQNIEYSWLSKRIDRDAIDMFLISHISGDRVRPQFQVLTSNYLNSSFYEYYYPEQYMPESVNYWQLPNSVYDGFNSIYTGRNRQKSVGKYNPKDTITQTDPNKIRLNKLTNDMNYSNGVTMPPQEQIIDLVVSTSLRQELGVDVGEMYKMQIQNKKTGKSFYIRSRITHSFKQGPGFDILRSQAFVSWQQAEYLYSILDQNVSKTHENEKLLIKGKRQDLLGIANAIIAMSPDQTQAFNLDFVSQSFQLLEDYLNRYVVFITAIMSCLAILFLFLYTIGKCRQEAQMYKMLRAIGLSASKIRIMVFAEIMVRLIVSIFNGIILGIVLSIGFSLQVEQFLMLKTPSLNLTTVFVIAAILLVIFSITIITATKYLKYRTVANTNSKI